MSIDIVVTTIVYTGRESGSDGKPFVQGPGNGCDYYAGTLWPDMRLSSKADALAAARIANEAYKQGMKAAFKAMNQLLNI